MSYDNPEFDLLAAFQQRFGLAPKDVNQPPDTKVLSSARFVYDNAIDVSLSMAGTKAAAASIWKRMQEKAYSTGNWSAHELHPKDKTEATVAFIFTIDVLNFSFWSELGEKDRFCIEYKGKTWTGYWSLVAAIQRALDEEIPITSSDFWQNEEECNDEMLEHVFRSATREKMPLLPERMACLREAGRVLYEKANGSAAGLVNLIAREFPSFRDEVVWEDRNLHFLKRAQILVADLWACFDGQGYGTFHDIDTLTIFPDYRIPQILYSLNVISYSPPLESRVRRKIPLEAGGTFEVQIRGCSIWAVELIKQEIKALVPDAEVNTVLLDFFLYDTIKEMEAAGDDIVPHHRTRSIWY